jgi:hypothetical protein
MREMLDMIRKGWSPPPGDTRAFFSSVAHAAGVRAPKQLPRWLVPLGGSVLRLLARSQRISNARFRAVSTWRPRYARASNAWDDVLEAMDVRPALTAR